MIVASLWPKSVEVIQEQVEEVTELQFNIMGNRQLELATHWLELNHTLLLIGKVVSAEITPSEVKVQGVLNQSNINWLSQLNDNKLTLLFEQSKWIYSIELNQLAQEYYGDESIANKVGESKLSHEHGQIETLKEICQKQHISLNVNRVSNPNNPNYQVSFTLNPNIKDIYSIRRLAHALKKANIPIILIKARIDYHSIHNPDITIDGQLQYIKAI